MAYGMLLIIMINYEVKLQICTYSFPVSLHFHSKYLGPAQLLQNDYAPIIELKCHTRLCWVFISMTGFFHSQNRCIYALLCTSSYKHCLL